MQGGGRQMVLPVRTAGSISWLRPVGGQDTDITFVGTAELYDPNANVWSPAGILGTARAEHTATLLENGKSPSSHCRGRRNRPSLSTVELYDPDTNSWTSAGTLAAARFGHTATWLPRGNVLIVGGFGAESTAERYAPATLAWGSQAH